MTPTWLRGSGLGTVGGFALGAVIGLAFWLVLLTVAGLQLGLLLALATALGVLLTSAVVVLGLMQGVDTASEPGGDVARKSGSSPLRV